MLVIESLIMMANNRPLDWLSFRPPEEQAAILKVARQIVPEHRQLHKARMAATEVHRLQQVQAKEKAQKQREQWCITDIEAITRQLSGIPGGLWTTAAAVEERLSQLTTEKEKTDALKTQLRFRKKVMAQKASSLLFAFSKAKVAFTASQLKANLLQLLLLSPSVPTQAPLTDSEDDITDDDAGSNRQ